MVEEYIFFYRDSLLLSKGLHVSTFKQCSEPKCDKEILVYPDNVPESRNRSSLRAMQY